MNLFGKDIAGRFIAMCTFADGKAPLAMETFKEASMTIDEHCQFNNSAIWVSTDETNTRFFYDLCYKNCRVFTDLIRESQLGPVSTKNSA